jgi:lipid-binding SYLF domain-containing protein
MRNASLYTCLMAGALLTLAGCATAPDTEAQKAELRTNSDKAMTHLKTLDPSVQNKLANAYGYAIFPSVGKGGAIVGGAYGRGEVYEQGKMVGWADLSQATIGAQLGGQSFSELILFENKAALDNFRNGRLKFAANASAVALKSGAAESAAYTDGVLVLVEPISGLMVEAALGGQSFSFQPV